MVMYPRVPQNLRVNMDELFTATTLACGPSPRDPYDNRMAQYQFDLIKFWREAGVKDMDDPDFRCDVLSHFFAWETKNKSGD
jgi:hypothetical protein